MVVEAHELGVGQPVPVGARPRDVLVVVEHGHAHGRAGYRPSVRTLAGVVAAHAVESGDRCAFVGGDHRMTWRDYDGRASGIAGALVDAGVTGGDRVAVLLADGPAVHACYVGVERAGGVIVGVGPRAGRREVEHLLDITGASLVLSGPDLDQRLPPGLPRLAVTETELPAGGPAPARAGRPDDLWLLNSTSGTTGRPKCVTHDQRRWFAFQRRSSASATCS